MRRYLALTLLTCLALGCGEASTKSAAKGKQAALEMRPAAAAKLAEDQGQFQLVYARADQPPLPSELQRTQEGEFNTESYDHVVDNPFLLVRQDPLSTFSIDVDTASYANVRRFLNQGKLPPPGAVRIEEMVNYFPYDYSPPTDGVPFATHVELAACPWNPEHRLARIALKGKEISQQERPAASLVFLLDVSGSMNEPNKLPLLKAAMKVLVQNLTERDRVAIAVYAGAAGLVLPSTSCETKGPILAAIDQLQAGGTTAGGAGIQLAYKVAQENYAAEQINRVVLCTDGDFNVGVTNQSELVRIIEEKAKSGVYLTVLGFGMGNYKDSTLEKLADKGNGNYGYIDTLNEARKMLVEQLSGTLVTIAKDVKIQIEFNPARVGAYRLIGYENRLLRAEDFNDDKKDAGEIGAGHTVTALYELVPAGKEAELPKVDPLKYQQPAAPSEAAGSSELLTLKLRYKLPEADKSELLTFPVSDSDQDVKEASADFRFAAGVACFGMLLRDSEHKGSATFDMALDLARSGKGADPHGYRGELVQLVELAKSLAAK
jgi:Ca-activated chloride channel family protein